MAETPTPGKACAGGGQGANSVEEPAPIPHTRQSRSTSAAATRPRRIIITSRSYPEQLQQLINARTDLRVPHGVGFTLCARHALWFPTTRCGGTGRHRRALRVCTIVGEKAPSSFGSDLSSEWIASDAGRCVARAGQRRGHAPAIALLHTCPCSGRRRRRRLPCGLAKSSSKQRLVKCSPCCGCVASGVASTSARRAHRHAGVGTGLAFADSGSPRWTPAVDRT